MDNFVVRVWNAFLKILTLSVRPDWLFSRMSTQITLGSLMLIKPRFVILKLSSKMFCIYTWKRANKKTLYSVYTLLIGWFRTCTKKCMARCLEWYTSKLLWYVLFQVRKMFLLFYFYITSLYPNFINYYLIKTVHVCEQYQ